MTAYRTYQLNRAGRIESAGWIEAETDEDAVRLARASCGAGIPTVEVWDGPRRVAAVDCAERPAAGD